MMRMTMSRTNPWKIAAVSAAILGAFSSLPAQDAAKATTPSPAAAPSAEPPPALEEYLGRTIAQTMHYTGGAWLVRTKREREEAASLMREKLELKPGMIVCDLGCGNGYHT